MEEAGRLWAPGNEPLEVRKRFPQIFYQFVGVRLVLFVVSFSRALLPFESQKLILKGVRGNTCQSTRVVCGNAHPVDFVRSIKATDIFCEHEQRRVFDLVEDTFVARF